MLCSYEHNVYGVDRLRLSAQTAHHRRHAGVERGVWRSPTTYLISYVTLTLDTILFSPTGNSGAFIAASLRTIMSPPMP